MDGMWEQLVFPTTKRAACCSEPLDFKGNSALFGSATCTHLLSNVKGCQLRGGSREGDDFATDPACQASCSAT